MDSKLNIVNEHLKFSKVNLKEPLKSGFILISAEVDKKTSFWGESKTKKKLIAKIKTSLPALKSTENVLDITLFKASMFPPGRNGGYLAKAKAKPNNNIHDKYDVVLLIELDSVKAIETMDNSSIYKSILNSFKESSSYYFVYKSENLRRIGSVNHKKSGVFLFNYFVANKKSQNLGIWEYTAGWFQDETKLDNSTLFSSVDNSISDYSVINHCRWDGFMKILPSLVFKKTFKTYVLENFEANDVAAIPILFKLA